MTIPLAVLIIEDQESDAQLIIRLLRNAGYELTFERAETAQEMRSALKKQAWDIVISDFSLPQFDAPAALTLLQGLQLDVPFIVVSGTIGEDTAVAMMKAGAHDYLMKSNLKRLVPAVKRELVQAKVREERRQAETELRVNQARWRALIENSTDAIALLDINGTILYESPSAQRLSGYSPGELAGRNIMEELHPDDLPRAAELFNRTLQQVGVPVSGQVRVRRKDQMWRWIEFTGTNLLNNPIIHAIVLNYRDITRQKDAEEKTYRQINYLTSLREVDQAILSSFDLQVTLDTLISRAITFLKVDAAAILLINPTTNFLEYAAGYGFQTEAIHTTSVKLGESYAGIAAMEEHTVQIPNLAEDPNNIFPKWFLKDENFVSYYGVPLIVKGNVIGVMEAFHRSHVKREQDWFDFLETLTGQAAIAIDNAQLWEQVQRHAVELEHRVAERTEELNRANIELEHTNRAKSEFLAIMSHELRTPLNSILGLSESLLEQRRDPLTKHQQQSLQIVESSGQHLLELINDVLDLSRIEAGKFDYYPQIMDVDTLCRSSMVFLKEQAMRKSITVTYQENDRVSKFYGDPRRAKQMIVNLLTNAVKFTPDRGHVELQVHENAERDLIQFSVIDDGIGIAEDDLRQLFQPFVQVDSKLNRQFEGTGLGLSLVQKLADLHGGSVEVESEVGKGSRFTINLPRGKDIVAQQEMIETGSGPPMNRTKVEITTSLEKSTEQQVILLAEDNIANILTISEYLKSHGYEVLIAHDGFEAIEKAEETKPDIILMDIQMPAMDGLEATRRLRANSRFASTPMIALTALAMPGDRERCLEAGVNEYMSKPVSLKGLVKSIELLLQQNK